MTYAPMIYDWPTSCAPIDQIFWAGGQAIAGGMTLGGVSVENPEPGGRATCSMNFAAFVDDDANRDASWLASRIRNGNIMRVPLWETVQLVPADQIFGAAADHFVETVDPFSDIPKTAWNPSVAFTAPAAKGSTTVVANMGDLGQVLREGHVIGYKAGSYDFAHVVMAVSYAGNVATATIDPPLRRAIAVADRMLLRPMMLATCANPSETIGTFTMGRTMRFGSAVFKEALV